MAQITVESNEFPDIVMCYLLQCLKEGKKLTIHNELFDYVLERLHNAGISANLLWAYMNMDTMLRVKYHQVADSLFNESVNSSYIKVLPEGAEEKKEQEKKEQEKK